MVSTSISPKSLNETRQFVSLFDTTEEREQLFPLFSCTSQPESIDLSDEGFVIENHCYKLTLCGFDGVEPSSIEVFVNGDALAFSEFLRKEKVLPDGRNAICYEAQGDDRRLFLLVHGVARIEVSFEFDSAVVCLSTKDVACFSREDSQNENVKMMLSALLDGGTNAVSSLMFDVGPDAESSFSVVDGSLVKGGTKSLSSFLQLVESSLAVFEKHVAFFRNGACSKVIKRSERVSASEVRKIEGSEMRWIARNPELLQEVVHDTGISFFGRHYLPRYIETDRTVRTFDNYENRMVVAYLEGVLRSLVVLSKNMGEVESSSRMVKRISSFGRQGYSCPLLTVLEAFEGRRKAVSTKVDKLLKAAYRLKRSYAAAMPGVGTVRLSSPRRTKIFQDVRAYSDIYISLLRWLNFGEFSLNREQIALRTFRLDRLYEYYVLYRILSWCGENGFRPCDGAAIKARYSLEYEKYRAVERVPSLFRLESDRFFLSVYYQPVIYGDDREENGVTLHRVNGTQRWDSFYTPDYLIFMKEKDTCSSRWIALDAKYSKVASVAKRHGGRDSLSALEQCFYKYRTNVIDSVTFLPIESVWLLCGRDGKETERLFESASWAKRNKSGFGMGGAVSLSPSADLLSLVFAPIAIGCKSDESEEVSCEEGDDVICSPEEGDKDFIDPVSKVIFEFESLMVKPKALYEARWAQRNLGISRPVLRSTCPSNIREKRMYSKVDRDGEVVYVLTEWLPPDFAKLRRLLSVLQSNAKKGAASVCLESE